MLQVTNHTQYLRFEMTQLLQFKKKKTVSYVFTVRRNEMHHLPLLSSITIFQDYRS